MATISIAALDANKSEGNPSAVATTPFTFTVIRTGNQNGISSVHYKVSGSGVHPADVNDFGGTWPEGDLSFNGVSQNSQILTINVPTNDIQGEDDDFAVTLSAPANANLGTAVAYGLILNDDVLKKPVISIAALASDKAEGDTGSTPFTFTLTRSKVAVGGADLTEPSSVNYTISGSANAADFVGSVISKKVDFAGGEASKTLTINVQGDNVFENDEGFTVTLSNPTDATLGTATAANGYIRNESTDYYFFTRVIGENTNNFNLRAEAVAAGWNQTAPLHATVTVNAGVFLGSSTTAGYAFETGVGFPAGTILNLVNEGFIIGAGGAGGAGQAVSRDSSSAPGLKGGPSVLVQSPISITNRGVIGGGGGGGGGGGSRGFGKGGSGGGGRGMLGGTGAVGATSGSGTVAGIGVLGGASGARAGTRGGKGGDGGDLGVSGGNGVKTGSFNLGGAGGAGGAAIVGSANIAWQNLPVATDAAHVKGALQ